jgi:hypothetical protein
VVDDLRARRPGLRLYGLTPPKRGQDPQKLGEIADRQVQRIAALAPDALVLYDLQDEPGRTAEQRPFPFLPTLEPLAYAQEHLAALSVPRVVYKCVANLDRAGLLAWARALAEAPGRDACVLVGAPTSAVPRPEGTLDLAGAYRLFAEQAPEVWVGGVAIAERHARKLDEDQRLLAKHAAGCRFFISQTVFDAAATKSLLSDYALRFGAAGIAPPPFFLSLSPCGSLKTMQFMKWLGIAFPRWLENELRHAPDILRRSVDLAIQIFADVRAFAADKNIPLGVNVESVSIRKEEIEASAELFAAVSTPR